MCEFYCRVVYIEGVDEVCQFFFSIALDQEYIVDIAFVQTWQEFLCEEKVFF
jgi:hypothetical protein